MNINEQSIALLQLYIYISRFTAATQDLQLIIVSHTPDIVSTSLQLDIEIYPQCCYFIYFEMIQQLKRIIQ